MMQEDNHIFQGLKRDNHQIRQENQYLWNAHNIRLTNRDDSTLLSITNERGTSDKLLNIFGRYVGHCVLGKYLVVFTYDESTAGSTIHKTCSIFRIEKTDESYIIKGLFSKEVNDTGWNTEHPIETIGVYENDLVQKVYWIDGINQPRVINIVDETLKDSIDDFNFVQTLKLQETVEVTKNYGEGLFSPGVIQYAFTYYNKYGQESNIFYTTPLNYITPVNRGEKPEERVSNSFRIELNNLETRFDYVRIYSIQRTSIDAVPTVKRLADLPLTSTTLSYTDTGTTGDIVDENLLMYIGGRDIVPQTMCAKDGTLFFGNIEIKEAEDWLDIKNEIKSALESSSPGLAWLDTEGLKTEPYSVKGLYYKYDTHPDITGFKSNETYRCGIQLQYKTGAWSEPIFIEDKILNTSFPGIGTSISWETKKLTISRAVVNYLKGKGYLNVRPCVVFPKTIDRDIICQGILCPTVFNVQSRSLGSPYAMSSWFFRPNTKIELLANDINNNTLNGANIEFRHNYPLLTGPNKGAEIQCTPHRAGIKTLSDITSSTKESSYFFVDSNIVTFHSPDIEFDTDVQSLDLEGDFDIKMLGYIELDAISGDINILTATPTKDNHSNGFVHKTIGYQVGNDKEINGGLISGLFYNDGILTNENKIATNSSVVHYMVYPWHRSGSLNNSPAIEAKDGIRSAELSKKKISNLKFFNTFVPYSFTYKIGKPELFNSNELELIKVWVDYLNKYVPYYGNVDTLITANNDDVESSVLTEGTNKDKGYHFYIADIFNEQAFKLDKTRTGDDKTAFSSNDPVRMKYKSTPHFVFSLKDSNDDSVVLLPTTSEASLNGSTYTIPSWDKNTNTSKDSIAADGQYHELWAIHAFDAEEYLPTVSFYKKDIGKYLTDLHNHLYKIVESTDNPNSGKIQKVIIEAGEYFKVIGDGKSCLVNGKFDFIGDNKKDARYYQGPTLLLEAINVSYDKDTTKCSFRRVEGTRAEDTDPIDTFIIHQEGLDSTSRPFLILAELRRKHVSNKFGGNSAEAKRNNLWYPAGEPVNLVDNKNAEVVFTHGDTWFSRYDCLKTYPFTQEDENQIIEIGSFMCETRVNIDGRYDRNRGQSSNLNMSPVNFNLLNEVYSQKNNFFNYRIFEEDYYKNSKFSNQITWSLEKTSGSDTDPWTNITLANTLDLDGNKGIITALKVWNEHLLCFQEKAVNQIMFNSRVQIPTTDGVPIEISNGYKVDGSRIINGNIGCQNKWSIIDTSNGLYFLDSESDSIYIFNGQIANLSEAKGMIWWSRQNHSDKVWTPDINSNIFNPKALNGIRAFYDKKNGDIYFTPGKIIGTPPDAMCYSEKLGQFTSLMSYGGVQAMFNFADGFYSLVIDGNSTKLYENNVGEYNNFYGEYKGWDFSFISNQNPGITKIFDTIELRTDHYKDADATSPLNNCPFNFIQVNNEYQDSEIVDIDKVNMRKKFRIWRGLIPRHKGTMQRIRNPWSMITLGYNPNKEVNKKKAIVHDVSVKYTI